VVLHDGLDLVGVLMAQLVVAHRERDEPLVGAQTLHNRLEICLQLVAGQVNASEVLVRGNDVLANDRGGLEAQALVPETQFVIALVKLHL
jgi:hypothetical protein